MEIWKMGLAAVMSLGAGCSYNNGSSMVNRDGIFWRGGVESQHYDVEVNGVDFPTYPIEKSDTQNLAVYVGGEVDLGGRRGLRSGLDLRLNLGDLLKDNVGSSLDNMREYSSGGGATTARQAAVTAIPFVGWDLPIGGQYLMIEPGVAITEWTVESADNYERRFRGRESSFSVGPRIRLSYAGKNGSALSFTYEIHKSDLLSAHTYSISVSLSSILRED